MNLSSLSSQLNLSIQDLRVKAKQLGFFISPRANKVDNYLAKKITEALTPKPAVAPGQNAAPKLVKLPPIIRVRDFAELLRLPVTQVIKTLIQNGIMATINEEVDFDTASIIAQDLGFEVESEATSESVEYGLNFLQKTLAAELPENLRPRPPIVAVMGHVDHGKTTLLDAVRKTDVAAGESGGITQHIGAYQIEVRPGSETISQDSEAGLGATSPPGGDFARGKITFLDTPGHEAFVEMRARGANVTDLIVLVVAADDGVRPQTVEVINRAKFTNTPIIVAINKTDKENANPARVKQELAEYGIVTEEWGGKTIAVEISAKTGRGIDQLLEMILLTAGVENFKANPRGATIGTVIESHLSQGKGAVGTVIVQNGTLKIGDIISAGAAFGKVKSLEDEHGRKLKSAGPAAPVQISGFSATPEVGDILQSPASLEQAKLISLAVQKKQRTHRLNTKRVLEGDASTKSLNLILKADVSGSLEAIKQSLSKLKNDEVKINILSEGVGEVNESDVLSAANSKAAIVAFCAKTNPKAINLAKQKKVVIDTYEVIYELLEDITSAVIKLFTPELVKTSFGTAKVLAIFRTEKGQMIVGGKVENGEIKKNRQIIISRAGENLGRGEILDLQQSKTPAKSVEAGSEFGMKIKSPVKVQSGDVLESFEETLKQKTL